MQRRQLIQLSGAAALIAVGGVMADERPTKDLDAKPKVIHIYATADGESHLKEVIISPDAKPIAGATMLANAYKPAKVQWHTVPAPQFTINMTGELDVEVSDGTRKHIGPGDLVYLEDTHGKGHVTHLLSPVTNVFTRVPEGFNFSSWVKGE